MRMVCLVCCSKHMMHTLHAQEWAAHLLPMTTNLADQPRDNLQRFAEKPQSAPSVTIAASAPDLIWIIEGDDHEVERATAATRSEALAIAASAFSERYDARVPQNSLVVVGVFEGDELGDQEDWVFKSRKGSTDEARARRALDNV